MAKEKKKSTFWSDFKAFLSRGNILDMAVGVIIGGAFGKIVSGLVNFILNPIIGYKNSTKVAKEANETNRSVYDIVLEKGLMTKEELDAALDPVNMLQSQKFSHKK